MNQTYLLKECDATQTVSTQGDAFTADTHLITEAVGLPAATSSSTDVGPAALDYSIQPSTPLYYVTLSPIEVKSSDSELESKQRLDAELPVSTWSKREKKRFNAAINRGLTRSEAIRFAIGPIIETKAMQNPKKEAKTKLNPEPAKQQNIQVKGTVKLGFISTDRFKSLTAEHMETLKAAILQAILLYVSPVVGPGFKRCVPRDVWLLLECEDNNTAEWVRSNFEHIKALSKLDVELMEEDEFPRHHIRGIFPDSSETPCDTILAYINCQNKISTKQWRVAQRTDQDATTHLALLVDTQSYRTLTAWNGIVKYCYGKIKLELENKVAKGVTAGTVSVPFVPDVISGGTKGGKAVKQPKKATKACCTAKRPKRVRRKRSRRGKASGTALQSAREGNERS